MAAALALGLPCCWSMGMFDAIAGYALKSGRMLAVVIKKTGQAYIYVCIVEIVEINLDMYGERREVIVSCCANAKIESIELIP